MLNLLIVEDEKLDREGLLTDIDWQKYGFYDIRCAKNGQEALKLINQFSPDLILSDINMPGISGIELIQKIREKLGEVKVIFISGYDYFEYAKQAVKLHACEYLLKPVDAAELESVVAKITAQLAQTHQQMKQYSELKRRVDEAKCYIVNNMLTELIYQDVIDIEDIVSELEYCGFDFTRGKYLLACISIDDYESYLLHNSVVDNRELCIKLCMSAQAHKDSAFCIQSGYIDLKSVLIFLSCDNAVRDEAILQKGQEMASAIIDRIEIENGLSISVGISEVLTHLDGLRNAYADCWRALGRKFHQGKGHVYFDDINAGAADMKLDFEDIAVALSKAVLMGDREQVTITIDNMFMALADYRFYDKSYIQNLCINIVSRLTLTVYQVSGNGESAFLDSSELIRKLLKLETIVDLKMWIQNVFRMTMDIILSKSSSRDRLVNEIVGYIEEHYSENISLKGISTMLHYSPNYVGNIFKAKFSKGFSEYVIEFRMNKALELLQKQKYMVYEIAEQVGYQSTAAFIKQFRKSFGITPTEASSGESWLGKGAEHGA